MYQNTLKWVFITLKMGKKPNKIRLLEKITKETSTITYRLYRQL